MNQFTIRLDDITPDMNWDNFYRIKEILDKYNIKPLLGVVPDNLDKNLCFSEKKEDFWNIIRELQVEGYVISQHGYQHIYETKESGLLKLNEFSEFAGVSYERQFDKIKKGHDILENAGVHTDVFMAPGHSYDKNTIKALKELGFLYVTDGFYHRPYSYGGLVFLPCSMLESYKGKGINTICFHLNRKNEKDFIELEEFIRENRSSIVDYNCKNIARVAVHKGICVWFEERKYLVIYRIKSKLAQSKEVAEYMVLTNSKRPVLKLIKRVVYLPFLLFKLLKNRQR